MPLRDRTCHLMRIAVIKLSVSRTEETTSFTLETRHNASNCQVVLLVTGLAVVPDC
jgi:hypothetical protein